MIFIFFMPILVFNSEINVNILARECSAHIPIQTDSAPKRSWGQWFTVHFNSTLYPYFYYTV